MVREPKGPNRVVVPNTGGKELKAWTVPDSCLDITTHVVCKGDDTCLVDELLASTSRRGYIPDAAWNVLDDMVDEAIAPCDITPMSFEEAWATMNLDASPGEPWCNRYATKRDFMTNPDDLEELIEFAASLEEMIITEKIDRIDWPVMSFKAHSKRDKYSLKKVTNRRFRSIQGIDVVLNLIMARWLAKFDDCLYERLDNVFIKNNSTTWVDNVVIPFSRLYTWGLDYEAYDKSIPGNVVYDIVSYCMRKVGAPEPLCQFVATQISVGPLVLPDGEVMPRFGANPSGEYLTTIVNSFYNIMITTDVFSTVLKIDPATVREVITYKVTGDDGLFGKADPDVNPVLRAAELITQKYGIGTKLDLHNGELYPASPGCHAPYLGLVSVGLPNGQFLSVPLEPSRSITRGFQKPRNDTPQDEANRLVGVRQALQGYLVLRDWSPDYPEPEPVTRFFSHFEQFRKSNPGLDWTGAVPVREIAGAVLRVVEEGGVV